MALRKASVQKQMEGAVQPHLEQGEREVAAGLCEGGPSRWWTVISVWLVMFMIKPYYMVVTDRRVIWLNVSTWTGRPKGLLRADPRADVAVVDHAEHPVWNNFKYRHPSGAVKKLRYHRIWREEMGACLRELGAPVGAAAEGGSFSA
jgi:hypothetical protein